MCSLLTYELQLSFISSLLKEKNKPVNWLWFLFKASATHVLSIYHVDVYVILCLGITHCVKMLINHLDNSFFGGWNDSVVWHCGHQRAPRSSEASASDVATDSSQLLLFLFFIFFLQLSPNIRPNVYVAKRWRERKVVFFFPFVISLSCTCWGRMCVDCSRFGRILWMWTRRQQLPLIQTAACRSAVVEGDIWPWREDREGQHSAYMAQTRWGKYIHIHTIINLECFWRPQVLQQYSEYLRQSKASIFIRSKWPPFRAHYSIMATTTLQTPGLNG